MFIKYLTTVFDHIGTSILLVNVEPDARFRVLIANKSFGEESGLSRDVTGKYVDEIVSASTYQQIVKHYQRVITSKEVIEYSEWFSVPSGRRAYDIKMVPILSTVGECEQIVVISRDVTSQQEMFKEACAAAALAEYLVPRIPGITVVLDKDLAIAYNPSLSPEFIEWKVSMPLRHFLDELDYKRLVKLAEAAKKGRRASGVCTINGKTHTYDLLYNAAHQCFILHFAEERVVL